MKLKLIIGFLFVILGLTSLNSCNKCNNYDCFTPPTNYRFIIMDSANGQDLIYNKTFETRFVKVFNNLGQSVEHNFYADSNLQHTFLNTNAFWETNPDQCNFEIRIHNDTSEYKVLFTVLQMEHNENCCTFYSMEKFNVFSYKSSIDKNLMNCEIYLNEAL